MAMPMAMAMAMAMVPCSTRALDSPCNP